MLLKGIWGVIWLGLQGQAVEYQTEQVVAFQKDFAQGKVSRQELEREEGLLSKMTVLS